MFDAAFTATLPNYKCSGQVHSKDGDVMKLVPIYYMDTLAEVNFVPTEFVDISEETELKIKSLICYYFFCQAPVKLCRTI